MYTCIIRIMQLLTHPHMHTYKHTRTQEVHPTVFVGVPRVWEKFRDKIEDGVREASGLKEIIFSKARVSCVHTVM